MVRIENFSRLIRKPSYNKNKGFGPTKLEMTKLYTLIGIGIFFLIRFLLWFFLKDKHEGNPFLFWVLIFSFFYVLLRWIHEWYHYCFLKVIPKPKGTFALTVDIFTTFCKGEPKEMLYETLIAIKGVEYPHENYLCDEANDVELRDFCKNHDIKYITRKVKNDAKAGNINNALRQSKGEICVILDPDHVPNPNFLKNILPFFNNPKVGFVQCVQGYKNQAESFVARAAAEQTYTFYGPLMIGMNGLGTVQAIGANCTFRRAALDSIGGHSAGLSEDMHTAMQIHAKGWQSIYVPEALTYGLVPSSLSAFYKQQLKWSRGTFELLFFTYPKLFKNFNFQQKLHYFFLPLFYLSGIITFIDIFIPPLSLILSDTPWKVDIKDYIEMTAPLFFMVILIRLYAQKWLIEKSERGFHIAGGLLQFGTWWIYLAGFFSTLLRVKIPYIPTPKEGEIANEWKPSIINFGVIILSFMAIWYGLKADFSPYSIMMSFFCFLNIIILGFIVLIAQQKILHDIDSVLGLKKRLLWWSQFINNLFYSLNDMIRKNALSLSLLLLIFTVAYSNQPKARVHKEQVLDSIQKDFGGFYTGIYIPGVEQGKSINPVFQINKSMDTKFDIVSIYQSWGQESVEKFPSKLLYDIRRNGSIPMITWEPYTHNFPEFKDDKALSRNWHVFEAILTGRMDNYILTYAQKIRDYGEPVMIRFAHEMDNPDYPWSFYGGGNTPEEFIQAHQYIVRFFDKMGATNVTWVWNPWEDDNLEKYYPGDDFVDWIGVTNLNYGLANSNGKWVKFEDLYKPFHDKIAKYNKSVMLSEFGSTTYGGDRAAYMKDAFHQIKSTYKEIKSVVFFYNNTDKNWGMTKWRPTIGSKYIDWTFDNDLRTISVLKDALKATPFTNRPYLSKGVLWQDYQKPVYHSNFVKGVYPNFSLKVNDEEIYIKGVAYNVNQDWRDVKDPLTMKELNQDFEQIKSMGANTIRRYASDIYDYNVINAAKANKLKIIFGFWFEKDVNYVKDEEMLEEYEEFVLSVVAKHKNDSTILAWSLGNEVWGLLKLKYGQPYLSIVRREYTYFIERLAEKIHAIDPNHPVFTVAENSKKLAGEMYMYSKLLPSVDVLGINSYYDEQINILPSTQFLTDTLRPYLVSEFGPTGYWDGYLSKFNENKRLVENNGTENAERYATHWKEYIAGKKGLNVGGVAYTWQDRMEGTNTWFGITDSEERLKPVYYALKEQWTAKKEVFPIADIYIYAPPNRIKPNKSVTFFALSENQNQDGLKYEWKLCSDEFIEHKVDMKIYDNGKRVNFVIPDNKSGLRLYLSVTDREGKLVNTASFPILK